MSMSLLYELQDELTRSLVAGSNLLGENFKLKKLIPELNEFGKRVPIFAKISGLLEKATASIDETTPQVILELLTLVNSILYTQAEVGSSGELVTPGMANLPGTEFNFQKLERLRRALTETGSGRYEIIKAVLQHEEIMDWRLLPSLIYALNDSYSEIAELAEQALLQYGVRLVPLLQKDFDLSKEKREVRKFRIIAKLSQGEGKEFYFKVLEEGTVELKAEALGALQSFPECLDLLLEYSSHKKKDLREAALKALVFHENDEVYEVLAKALLGKEAHVIAEACQRIKSEKFVIAIVRQAEQLLAELSGLAEKKLEQYRQQLTYLILALGGRKEPEIFKLYQTCFEEHQWTVNRASSGQASPADQAAENLLDLEDGVAYKILMNTLDEVGDVFLKYAMKAALLSKTAGFVYQRFGEFLNEPAKETHVKIFQVLHWYTQGRHAVLLDSRWLESLIRLNEYELVARVITAADQKYTQSLVMKLHQLIAVSANYVNNRGIIYLLKALIKVDAPDLWQEFQGVLAVRRDNCYGILDRLIKLIEELPARYAPQLEAYVRSNPEFLRAGELLLVAETLRNKNS